MSILKDPKLSKKPYSNSFAWRFVSLFLYSIRLTLLLVLIWYGPSANAIESVTLNPIQTKIAKSYSNKFCNAIGIGMSKQSAMKLSIMENSKLKYNTSLWLDIAFKGKEEIEEINKSEFSKGIYQTILEDCGSAIESMAGTSMKEFEDEFISEINNSK